MMNYHLRLTGEAPLPPKDADFSFTIDFAKGKGNPRRVFDSASKLIEGFEKLDIALVGAFSPSIEPILVLEDVEEGSLKVWLKNVLVRTDDEALKGLEWPKLIGRYLVRAKYITLEYCDSEDVGRMSKLEVLKDVFHRMAKETDVRYLPDYTRADDTKLVKAISSIQQAKSELEIFDSLTIEANGKKYTANLSSTAVPVAGEATKPARETHGEGEMVLRVRKPDLLKNTMWQFQHRKATITAPILDDSWLERFHRREFAIFPGDALRCRVKQVYSFDANGMLEDSKTEIVEVLEILRSPEPLDLFDEA